MEYRGEGGSAPCAPVDFTPTPQTTPQWEPLYQSNQTDSKLCRESEEGVLTG